MEFPPFVDQGSAFEGLFFKLAASSLRGMKLIRYEMALGRSFPKPQSHFSWAETAALNLPHKA
jgi:hypothetical protein